MAAERSQDQSLWISESSGSQARVGREGEGQWEISGAGQGIM